MNIEIVKVRSSLGGNGPIMANSLIELGNDLNFIGSLGENEVLPIFKPFADKCRSVISFSDPGITDAFEMNDGKVMFNYPQSILNISWEMIIDKVGIMPDVEWPVSDEEKETVEQQEQEQEEGKGQKYDPQLTQAINILKSVRIFSKSET